MPCILELPATELCDILAVPGYGQQGVKLTADTHGLGSAGWRAIGININSNLCRHGTGRDTGRVIHVKACQDTPGAKPPALEPLAMRPCTSDAAIGATALSRAPRLPHVAFDCTSLRKYRDVFTGQIHI
ncbi:hypothetical protein NPX13_g7831 [Xylaria arbuscula]|uniref:Uncharacterized protein n=1 Tax=Xylaria arbuscula TaxID=114810 RepID=A0A9W8NA54_9PEZI|nr:hypothetical protein NPX13_g7831 [Xylaria arbuscula]